MSAWERFEQRLVVTLAALYLLDLAERVLFPKPPRVIVVEVERLASDHDQGDDDQGEDN
jgi:hypothetical protein